MKIFTAEQTREIDRLTIESQGITSSDLMERAASVCARRIMELTKPEQEIHIYCGMGNNGGDGLAIGRLLSDNNFTCKVLIVRFREQFSNDAQLNYDLLKKKYPEKVTEISSEPDLVWSGDIAVDALLGTGTNQKPAGLLGATINHINEHYKRIISIDVPSGLYPDGDQEGQPAVRSLVTVTFQSPKLAFLLPENREYVKHFELLDIGLSQEAMSQAATTNYYVTAADIVPLLRKRGKFTHKGTFGHALLLAGSRGKSGAALLAAEACLRSGAGLLTLHSTAETLQSLRIRLPEAMSIEDDHSEMITQVERPERYHAVAFGPGTGTHEDTAVVLKKVLQHGVQKLVIDADGLNILAENKTWLEFLPSGCILTPHPGEFERLAGKFTDDTKKLKALQEYSRRYDCIMVLKGAHTCIAMPDGNLFFNSSGNPALAKGGTGDILTGIILGLASGGYNAPQAALIGVFIHGMAADLCAQKMGEETVLATDVIGALPKAFALLHRMAEQ